MRELASGFTVLCVLALSGCTPLSAIGLGGQIFNRIMENNVSQPYISDTRPTINPNEVALTNLNLGIEYMRLEKYELALERLQYARAAKPDYAPIYDALGLLYQRMKQPGEAEQYFQQALKLDQENPSTLNNYGQFLCSEDRVDDAEKYFLAAAENPLYRTPEIPYTNLGTCAHLHNQPDKAVDYYRRALTLNPYVPHALINMSEISCEQSDYASARDYLDRYLAINTQSPRTLWLGIRIERELGDKNKVSSYALLLRNKYPDSEEAKLLQESGIR
ncbi:MAG: type IV pilus biogenesis/stability protein PilW [Gammaproteobacteria bacterium]